MPTDQNPKDQSYVLRLKVNERSLAEGKNPPLCDGCGAYMQSEKDVEGKDTDNFLVNALILDAESFYGVECDRCVKKYFSKMPTKSREDVPAEVSQIVLSVLAQEMSVTFLDEEIVP